MNEQIKVLIAYVSIRNCFTDKFKAKPGVSIVGTKTLKIKKT